MDDTTTQVTEPVEGTTEAEVTPEQNAEPQADNQPTVPETPSEDSFFDPNTVPDELKPAYKQMQAAFTKKTQEIAEARKEAEAIRQKAEAYDKYQQHIPIVEQMLAQQRESQESPEMQALEQQYRAAGYDEESIKFMKMGIGFALNHVNQNLTGQREVDRISSQINEAAKVDPRLTDTSLVYQTADGQQESFGQIVEELVAADPKWKSDPVAATKRAIAKVDALIGKAKTDGKQELSDSAKSKARQFPTNQSSPQSATSAVQATSFRDAYKAAEKETGIRLK